MIRQTSRNTLDPAADAALLLRRIGFATLALALPIASLVSRRAAVVLVPIGVVLMVIAMLIESPQDVLRGLRRAVLGRAGFLLLALIGWSLLSLIWSPYTASALEKAGNLTLAVVLGICGTAALPDRMRASNLNLAALGTGVAAVFALVLVFAGALRQDDAAIGAIERGISIVLIMAWPSLAWLLSRERRLSALGLALFVGLLALTRLGQGEAIAMICGTVAFGAVCASRRQAPRIVALLVAGLMLFAPLLPFLLLPLVARFPEQGAGFVPVLSVWADAVRHGVVQLLTGHGLDTLVADRASGALPMPVPATLLFETWYELGIVGAVAAASCLHVAIRGTARMPSALAAGGTAAFTTAFALAALGFATAQPWWLMTLTAVVILFGAIARGQYRTERPLAPPLRQGPQANGRPRIEIDPRFSR